MLRGKLGPRTSGVPTNAHGKSLIAKYVLPGTDKNSAIMYYIYNLEIRYGTIYIRFQPLLMRVVD